MKHTIKSYRDPMDWFSSWTVELSDRTILITSWYRGSVAGKTAIGRTMDPETGHWPDNTIILGSIHTDAEALALATAGLEG